MTQPRGTVVLTLVTGSRSKKPILSLCVRNCHLAAVRRTGARDAAGDSVSSHRVNPIWGHVGKCFLLGGAGVRGPLRLAGGGEAGQFDSPRRPPSEQRPAGAVSTA